MAKQDQGADTFKVDQSLDQDEMGKEIAAYWVKWDAAKDIAKERWLETTQYVYATSTQETTNSQNGWSHSTHVPKLTQISDNLAANYMSALFPHDDWMSWVGDDMDSSDAAKRRAVEAYLKTKHKQGNFQNSMLDLIHDWILYGNCFAQVDYVEESNDYMGETIVSYSGPRVYRISPYDIVFNPMATDFMHSPKIIRTTKSLGELHRQSEESPDKGYYKEILEKVENFRSLQHNWKPNELEKQCSLRFDGYGSLTEYLQSGNVEILEFYGDIYDRQNKKFLKNHVVTVIDRCWVVRSEPLNTYSGRPNIFHCAWRVRPDNIWGMGPLDNLVGMQYLIDHLENARADAFDQMLVPTRVIAGDVEKYNVAPGMPGGEYRIPTNEGSVSNLAPDTTVLQADMEIDRKTREMEMYAGSPRESMGIRTPGEKTAREVTHLATAASRIFQNKIDYWEKAFLEPLINAEVEVAHRNLHSYDIARSIDDDLGIAEFLTITKEDLAAKGKMVPVGARHFARKNQLEQNLQVLTQVTQGDQLMQMHFPSIKLARVWSELLGEDRFNLVQPYGRIPEQQEAQRRMNAASDQIEAESMTGVGDEEDELEAQNIPG